VFEYLAHNAQDIGPPVGLNVVVDGTVPIGISPHSFSMIQFQPLIQRDIVKLLCGASPQFFPFIIIASILTVDLILYREGIFFDFFSHQNESIEFSS
jgi:hypothetical protein